MSEVESVTIGVLALQGAFAEHVSIFNSLPYVKAIEIRTVAELENVDGIVLPGGESTAIALIGEKNGIFENIKQWVDKGNPVWGTCAGCIMLAKDVVGQKIGGQGLIGGMDISVHRNYFGRQIASFEQNVNLNISNNNNNNNTENFPCVFIRAPAILGVKEGVRIIGEIKPPTIEEKEGEKEKEKIIVAAQQGNLFATVFHPELTPDKRVHQFYVEMVREYKKTTK